MLHFAKSWTDYKKCYKYVRDFAAEDFVYFALNRGFFSAYKGRLGPKLEKTKKSKAKHCAAAEVW